MHLLYTSFLKNYKIKSKISTQKNKKLHINSKQKRKIKLQNRQKVGCIASAQLNEKGLIKNFITAINCF